MVKDYVGRYLEVENVQAANIDELADKARELTSDNRKMRVEPYMGGILRVSYFISTAHENTTDFVNLENMLPDRTVKALLHVVANEFDIYWVQEEHGPNTYSLHSNITSNKDLESVVNNVKLAGETAERAMSELGLLQFARMKSIISDIKKGNVVKVK